MKVYLTSAVTVLAGLFTKVYSNFQLVTRSSLIANAAGATVSLICFPNDLQCFPIKIRCLWIVLYQERLTIYTSDKVVDFLCFTKATWFLFEINSLLHNKRPTGRFQPHKKTKRAATTSLGQCILLRNIYFIINIKPPGPSPTPTHPLWILLFYILKLKNNISIHFSVSRYNLTHEMTFLNVILPRRQTLRLYTMDLSSFMPDFQSP